MVVVDPVGRDPSGDLAVIKRPDYLSLWHLNVGSMELVVLDNFAITPTQTYLGILEGNTTLLRTINGGTEGTILMLRAMPGITAVRNVGNLKLQSNMTFASIDDTLMLLKTTTNWIEFSRSVN